MDSFYSTQDFETGLLALYDSIKCDTGISLPLHRVYFYRNDGIAIDVSTKGYIKRKIKKYKRTLKELTELLNNYSRTNRYIFWLNFHIPYYTQTSTLIFVSWGFSDITERTRLSFTFPQKGPSLIEYNYWWTRIYKYLFSQNTKKKETLHIIHFYNDNKQIILSIENKRVFEDIVESIVYIHPQSVSFIVYFIKNQIILFEKLFSLLINGKEKEINLSSYGNCFTIKLITIDDNLIRVLIHYNTKNNHNSLCFNTYKYNIQESIKLWYQIIYNGFTFPEQVYKSKIR